MKVKAVLTDAPHEGKIWLDVYIDSSLAAAVEPIQGFLCERLNAKRSATGQTKFTVDIPKASCFRTGTVERLGKGVIDMLGAILTHQGQVVYKAPPEKISPAAD